MDPSDRISYLLTRYLDNTCTRQEMDELLDYIKQNPEDERLMGALPQTWKEERYDADRDVDAGTLTWSEMQERLRDLPADEGVTYRERFPWKVAASILLMGACVGAFFFWQGNKNASFAESQPSEKKVVSTAKDEHRLIILSDGSKVWINGSSNLTCDPAFNNRTREVTLHGEAFFDIRHDASRPFIIKTGAVKITVLGTVFNIRAFPGENAVTVTVTRGKVRVEAENETGGIITANQQITLNLRSGQVEEHVVDAAEVSQWTKDDLILDDVTLGEVEEILEDRYSVDIRFNNELLRTCRFTSTFFHNASLEQVLTAICLVNGASYEVHEKVITVYGKGCDERTPTP